MIKSKYKSAMLLASGRFDLIGCLWSFFYKFLNKFEGPHLGSRLPLTFVGSIWMDPDRLDFLTKPMSVCAGILGIQTDAKVTGSVAVVFSQMRKLEVRIKRVPDLINGRHLAQKALLLQKQHLCVP